MGRPTGRAPPKGALAHTSQLRSIRKALSDPRGSGQVSVGPSWLRLYRRPWGQQRSLSMPFGNRSRLARASVVALALGFCALLVVGIGLATRCGTATPLLLPPAATSVTELRATPNVLVAVRDLARLESASFHMERVIDLREKQSRLYGLVEGEDAILLVAVADVSAGVDLGKLTRADLDADPAGSRARIRLPAAEVFHVALDPERTYVHTRRTSVLARRQEGLESRARREAERVLVDAAREAGLLTRANENAKRVVESLVRSLGYPDVEVTVSEPVAD